MILIGRVGQIEMYLDDEQQGPVGYNPEYLEDIMTRVGRAATVMFAEIPGHLLVAEDEVGGE